MSRVQKKVPGFDDRLNHVILKKFDGTDRKLATALGRVAEGLSPVALAGQSPEERGSDRTRADNYSPHVSRWRRKGLVSLGSLRLLSKATGYTADWWVGIDGAPEHGGQTRTTAALEEDLAAHVAREVAARGIGEPRMRPTLDAMISGSPLLNILTALVAEDCCDAVHRLAAMRKAARAINALDGSVQDKVTAMQAVTSSLPPWPSRVLQNWQPAQRLATAISLVSDGFAPTVTVSRVARDKRKPSKRAPSKRPKARSRPRR